MYELKNDTFRNIDKIMDGFIEVKDKMPRLHSILNELNSDNIKELKKTLEDKNNLYLENITMDKDLDYNRLMIELKSTLTIFDFYKKALSSNELKQDIMDDISNIYKNLDTNNNICRNLAKNLEDSYINKMDLAKNLEKSVDNKIEELYNKINENEIEIDNSFNDIC